MTVAAPLIRFRSQPHALPPCWRCIFEEQKTTAFVGARIRILFEKTSKAGQRKSIAMAQAMAHLVHADWYHRLGRAHLDSNCGWTSGVKNKAIVARGHQHKDQYLLVRQLQPVSSRSSACRGRVSGKEMPVCRKIGSSGKAQGKRHKLTVRCR